MKVCIFTGTRADYGLLRPLIVALKKSGKFDLHILATGSHLSPHHGLTIDEVICDEHEAINSTEILLSSNTPAGVVKSMGLMQISAADFFQQTPLDLFIVLGDRYEAMAATQAALIFRIPIVHIHGGEITSGSVDDEIRNSISQMASIHFPSTETYRNRLLEMGVDYSKVAVTGGLGVDALESFAPLDVDEVSKKVGLNMNQPIALITCHPETKHYGACLSQMDILIGALNQFDGLSYICTASNSDVEGASCSYKLREFCESNPARAVFHHSLGQELYFSCLKYTQLVIGNSSSGLLEVPSFKIATINIGVRQRGRLKSETIIDVDWDRNRIIKSIEKGLSKEFKTVCEAATNPYGNGNAALKMVSFLEQHFNL